MSSGENLKSRKVRRKRPCDSDVENKILKHKKKVLPKSIIESCDSDVDTNILKHKKKDLPKSISETITNSNSYWGGLSTDGSLSKIYINYKIMFLIN